MGALDEEEDLQEVHVSFSKSSGILSKLLFRKNYGHFLLPKARKSDIRSIDKDALQRMMQEDSDAPEDEGNPVQEEELGVQEDMYMAE